MFRRRLRNSQDFVKTRIQANNVRVGELIALTIGDEDVLLTRLDEAIIAFSGTCPHAAADLGDGMLHRNRISCPLHDWKFDLRSGRTLWPEDETCRLIHFSVNIIDDIVWLKV